MAERTQLRNDLSAPADATSEVHDDAGARLIAVAHLLRPQGRRGELLADPLTDLPGVLVAGRSVVLRSAGTPSTEDSRRGRESVDPLGDSRQLEEVWFPTGKNAGRVVLKLSGCDSISQAEMLAGVELCVPIADLPALEPDTFFVADLIGCELYDGPAPAGHIVDVQWAVTSTGQRLEDAAPLLAVQLVAEGAVTQPSALESLSAPGDEHNRDHNTNLDQNRHPVQASELEPVLVPFVRAWLESVDLAARRVVMHLPAGLLDNL